MANTTTPPAGASRVSPVTVVATLAAIGVAAGGILHYQIWNDRYRGSKLPDGVVPGAWVVKKGFPINFALSIILAVVLLAFAFAFIARIGRFALLAAGGLELGSIVFLVLSREASIFGWKETGWDADAKRVLVVEIVSGVLLAGALLLDMRRAGIADEA